MGTKGFQLFDCDQHNYEVRDSFTRHIPAKFKNRAVAPVTLPDGTEALLAGDKIVTSLEPEFGQAYKPGSLKEMLKQMQSGAPTETYMFEPMRPEYQNRDARIATMDIQGVDASIMYPGGWALMAEEYIREQDALYANVHSLNQWLEEDWGFAYQDRLFSPAVLSLRDLDEAVKELDWVLDKGARFILLSTGPVYGRSPGDPYFDPFWARINEAKATVAYHITEFYYNRVCAPDWGHDDQPIHFRMSAWQWMNTYGERPIVETLSALVFDNLFGRFPNINVLVSEFGASWVPHFLTHMDKSRGMGRNGPWIGGQLTERPSDVFRKHINVVPYPEDDTVALVEAIGNADSLCAGSDWPHAEGLAEPADFRKLIDTLSEEDQSKILWDNAHKLVAR